MTAPRGASPSELIAREIRAELGRQQLSNRRLAVKLGVSFMWVSRRVNTGETDLTAEDVQRIADALGVPATRLLAGWLPRLDSNQKPAGYRTESQPQPVAAAVPIGTGFRIHPVPELVAPRRHLRLVRDGAA